MERVPSVHIKSWIIFIWEKRPRQSKSGTPMRTHGKRLHNANPGVRAIFPRTFFIRDVPRAIVSNGFYQHNFYLDFDNPFLVYRASRDQIPYGTNLFISLPRHLLGLQFYNAATYGYNSALTHQICITGQQYATFFPKNAAQGKEMKY